MASSTDHGFFGVVGSNPTSTILKDFPHHVELEKYSPLVYLGDFPHVELEKYSPLVYLGNQTAWIIDRSARISGRPGIPPFQGPRESAIRLSLGKLLANLLQVVKQTNTPLMP